MTEGREGRGRKEERGEEMGEEEEGRDGRGRRMEMGEGEEGRGEREEAR